MSLSPTEIRWWGRHFQKVPPLFIMVATFMGIDVMGGDNDEATEEEARSEVRSMFAERARGEVDAS